jgi:regulator of sirC expression with transglutaminase-like and TPR domain
LFVLSIVNLRLPCYNYRGRDYFFIGDFQKAIADCNQVILLAPNSAAIYQNRGVIYHRLDNNQQAITDF